MPGSYTIETSDGRTFACTTKWKPEELNQMNAQQLTGALTEMRQLAHEYNTQFYQPITQLQSECRNLEVDKIDAKSRITMYGIVAAVCVVLFIILKATRHDLLAMFMIFLVIGGIALFTIKLIVFLSASAKYAKRYPEANAQIAQLQQSLDYFIYGSHITEYFTGKVCLPNYFLNETALGFMVQALMDHRAATLGQAINLYEQAKQIDQQLALLDAQLASLHRAEASAASAAAAASSAATSAHISATNSMYNRK